MTILGADEVIETARLRLGRMIPGDLASMAPWLAGVLAPDWQLDDLALWVEKGLAVLIATASGEPAGVMVAVSDAPEVGVVSVPLIAIEPGQRYRGLGSEAGLALERHLRGRGHERFLAPVPDGRGLAVYFWLRLGYRPLLTESAPWPLVGLTGESRRGIWMGRDSV